MTDINFYAAVAQPGDTLIVAAPNLRFDKDAAELVTRLELLLPGIRVVVVPAGMMAIYRPGDDI